MLNQIIDHSWTTHKDYPTGRLCLQAYSPYWRAKWVKQWRETKADKLDKKINVIIKDIKKAAPKVAELVAEGERQAEIERREWEAQKEQWRKEEEERRIAKALKDSTDELFSLMSLCLLLIDIALIEPFAWILENPKLDKSIKVGSLTCLAIVFHFDLLCS